MRNKRPRALCVETPFVRYVSRYAGTTGIAVASGYGDPVQSATSEDASTSEAERDAQLLRSPRFRWALGLWLLNYALGWPVIGLAGAASPWLGAQNAAMIGAGSYALSWVILGLAMLLGGSEIAVFGKRWIQSRRTKNSTS